MQKPLPLSCTLFPPPLGLKTPSPVCKIFRSREFFFQIFWGQSSCSILLGARRTAHQFSAFGFITTRQRKIMSDFSGKIVRISPCDPLFVLAKTIAPPPKTTTTTKKTMVNRMIFPGKSDTTFRWVFDYQPKTHCSQLAYFTSKKLKNKNAPNSQKNINKH